MPDEEPTASEAAILPELTPAEAPTEEPAAMLDVHPAHHAANSWKEFFVHIATIVLGLLIAVGLEQTVEYIHHRRQIAETREALAIERKINIMDFTSQTAEFRRIVPILQTDLAVFLYLQKHPGAPSAQWPGKLSFGALAIFYNDSAWTTAQQNNILSLMPATEVREEADLYRRLGILAQREHERQDAEVTSREYQLDNLDESHLSQEQIGRMIDELHSLLGDLSVEANVQRNLTDHHPDFSSSPSRNEIYQVHHRTYDPGDPGCQRRSFSPLMF